jgi:hypothetical protein
MTKTKQPKPVKAWIIVDGNGNFGSRWLFSTRNNAREYKNTFRAAGVHVVRVEIKVLK